MLLQRLRQQLLQLRDGSQIQEKREVHAAVELQEILEMGNSQGMEISTVPN